jgi:hypothetical protein
MAHGWVYLCAIVDRASGRALYHRISSTMGMDFCLEAGGCQGRCRVEVLNYAASLRSSNSFSFGVSGLRLT